LVDFSLAKRLTAPNREKEMPYLIELYTLGAKPEDRPVYFCTPLHPPTYEDLSPARVWNKLTTHSARKATQFTLFEKKFAQGLAQQLTQAGVRASAVYCLPWQLS
jgi:hypothetical protein